MEKSNEEIMFVYFIVKRFAQVIFFLIKADVPSLFRTFLLNQQTYPDAIMISIWLCEMIITVE